MFSEIQFFNQTDAGIQKHCKDTEEDDGHEEPVEFKEVKGQKDKITIVKIVEIDFVSSFIIKDLC